MKEKLNRYYQLLESIEQLKNGQAERIESAIPEMLKGERDEAQQALALALEYIVEATADVVNKYEFDLFSLENEAAILLSVVKDGTLEAGETIRGDHLMAVYTKGRSSWDGKGLDGFAVAFPDILKFKKVGEPSVSIRKL